jgi:hypothetical protein
MMDYLSDFQGSDGVTIIHSGVRTVLSRVVEYSAVNISSGNRATLCVNNIELDYVHLSFCYCHRKIDLFTSHDEALFSEYSKHQGYQTRQTSPAPIDRSAVIAALSSSVSSLLASRIRTKKAIIRVPSIASPVWYQKTAL